MRVLPSKQGLPEGLPRQIFGLRQNVSKMDTSKLMFQDVLIGTIIGSEPGFSGYQILRQTQRGLRQDSVTSGAWGT